MHTVDIRPPRACDGPCSWDDIRPFWPLSPKNTERHLQRGRRRTLLTSAKSAAGCARPGPSFGLPPARGGRQREGRRAASPVCDRPVAKAPASSPVTIGGSATLFHALLTRARLARRPSGSCSPRRPRPSAVRRPAPERASGVSAPSRPSSSWPSRRSIRSSGSCLPCTSHRCAARGMSLGSAPSSVAVFSSAGAEGRSSSARLIGKAEGVYSRDAFGDLVNCKARGHHRYGLLRQRPQAPRARRLWPRAPSR